jgi:hypothetical protein
LPTFLHGGTVLLLTARVKQLLKVKQWYMQWIYDSFTYNHVHFSYQKISFGQLFMLVNHDVQLHWIRNSNS